jgi:hypothetical protein
MTQTAYWREQHQRTKVLKIARDLARSGHHANHETIIAEIELSKGFADVRRCLTQSFIPGQLDRLCAVAQASAKANGRTLSAFLGQMRSTALSVQAIGRA